MFAPRATTVALVLPDRAGLLERIGLAAAQLGLVAPKLPLPFYDAYVGGHARAGGCAARSAADRLARAARRRSAVGEGYQRAMAQMERMLGDDLAAAIPVEAPRTLLDLAGGPGLHAAALIRRHPGLQATVVDLPAAVAHAQPLEGVAFVAGDLFGCELPTGARTARPRPARRLRRRPRRAARPPPGLCAAPRPPRLKPVRSAERSDGMGWCPAGRVDAPALRMARAVYRIEGREASTPETR